MTIDLQTIKSALVSVLLMAVVQVGVYVIQIGNVFQLDWRVLVNLGVISLITGAVSVIKNMLTTDKGNFMGLTNIK